jgi:hypothetical protein
MKNAWTPERKAQQAAAIRHWKPWQWATGPKTIEGKAIVSRNAFKGGRRPSLRNLMRELKQELAGQREFLDSFH